MHGVFRVFVDRITIRLANLAKKLKYCRLCVSYDHFFFWCNSEKLGYLFTKKIWREFMSN